MPKKYGKELIADLTVIYISEDLASRIICIVVRQEQSNLDLN